MKGDYHINSNEIKERFLTIKNNKDYTSILNQISTYETLLEKDASNFTREEALGYLASKESTTANALMTTLSALRTYADFYHQASNNPDAENAYRSIVLEDLQRCVAKEKNSDKFISKAELDAVVKNCSPRDQFVLLSLYEGLGRQGAPLSNILYLKRENLREQSLILLDGTEYPCSKELITVAKMASYQEEIRFKIGSTAEGSITVYDHGYVLNPTETTLSYFYDKDRLGRTVISNTLYKLKQVFNIDKFNNSSLAYSGLATTIREQADEYPELTFYDLTKVPVVKRAIQKYGYDKWKPSRLYSFLQYYL